MEHGDVDVGIEEDDSRRLGRTVARLDSDRLAARDDMRVRHDVVGGDRPGRSRLDTAPAAQHLGHASRRCADARSVGTGRHLDRCEIDRRQRRERVGKARSVQQLFQRGKERRRSRRNGVERAQDRRVADLQVQTGERTVGKGQPQIPGADEDAETGQTGAQAGVDLGEGCPQRGDAELVADRRTHTLNQGHDGEEDACTDERLMVDVVSGNGAGERRCHSGTDQHPDDHPDQ